MGRINYETRSAIPYSEQGLKLDRARELVRRLGNPQDRLRIVHLAGTKGKGSTGAMIATACQAAGHTVGVYSSPHMERINERFAIDGQPCTDAEFTGLVDRVRSIAEAMDSESSEGGPTFFDLTTAMALLHFAQRKVDSVVLEVGLGGRLDSTNLVTPEVSVVTSISLDHMKQLGSTRGQIAAEKAGIFKPGVTAVSGVTDAEAGDVIERIANEQGSPLYRRERDFDIKPSGEAWQFDRQLTGGTTETIEQVRPALPGTAQAENAAVALATLGVLADCGWNLPIAARREGANRGKLPARMERLPGEPLAVIDGAHNDASAEALAEALDTLCEAASRERRVLVVAVSDDKDKDAILKPLARRFDHVIATRYVDNPRAALPQDLAEVTRRFVKEATSVVTSEDPSSAWQLAKEKAGPSGAVVFAGSLLFAAEARRIVLAERLPR